MWESVKNCSSVCKEAGTRGWISRVARSCKPPDWSTCAKHAKSWSVAPAVHYRTKVPVIDPRASVSFSITHRCVVLVFASLFPYLCLFIFYYGCDFNWLRLFINFVYSLCSFSAHFVFVIKLELVIFNLGV